MAYFKIEEPNKPVKYISEVDTKEGTLTFCGSEENAYKRSTGIIADSMRDFIMFHFKEQYPEVKYIKVV